MGSYTKNEERNNIKTKLKSCLKFMFFCKQIPNSVFTNTKEKGVWGHNTISNTLEITREYTDKYINKGVYKLKNNGSDYVYIGQSWQKI